MRVLVTGASGFLGSHIVDACIRAGDRVRVLVRKQSDLSHLQTVLPGLEFVQGDLRDGESLQHAVQGIEAVHHSAARVTDHGTRAQFWDENVSGTQRLMAAALEAGVRRFVFISGPCALVEPQDGYELAVTESESFPSRHLSFHSETKAVAECRVLAASRPSFTTVALRPCSVWGPRDHAGFLPQLLTAMITGYLPDLSGGRRVYRSLCYCENVAEACVRAARAHGVGGKAYFITDGEPVEMWSTLTALAWKFGVVLPIGGVSPFTTGRLWKPSALTQHQWLRLSRYTLSLLTSSAVYDNSAARQDLAGPLVDHSVGMARLTSWIDGLGGVEEFLKRATTMTEQHISEAGAQASPT
ncbi:NAD-dependent epimerase/dehydratase family protein [Streptomyces violascens]|uniref:NAD-dependent epimerase/dehydratase family protein n=1 Tax=Streptomyces violascens TaxID=67381 RepID=UPI0036778B17